MKTKEEIIVLFEELQFDWINLYQSDLVKRKKYSEFVSSLIFKHFDKFRWIEKGLRKQNFKINDHIGACDLKTSISQITEKRFCYALYNDDEYELFGNVIDYEIPLTEPNQGKDKKNHGDVDFISVKNNEIFFFEAKANTNESILRAILELYVYLFRLIKYKRLETLIREYGDYKKVIPAIMLFHNSVPEKQFQQIEKYPNLFSVLKKINKSFTNNGVSKIRFFSADCYDGNNEHILKEKDGFITFYKQPVMREIIY